MHGRNVALEINGMLDAYWSDSLSKELESHVRAGATAISLDLSRVRFISSAGLRVLLIYLKQMKAIDGVLSISAASAPVQSILDLTGLTDLFLAPKTVDRDDDIDGEPLDVTDVTAVLYRLGEGADSVLLIHGAESGESKSADHPIFKYPSTCIGFGIGAFGGGERNFGEYLAAGGVTVCLPADGRNRADYMTEDGVFIPSITVYSGMLCETHFDTLLRFHAGERTNGIEMSRLAQLVLDQCDSTHAAFLLIGEAVYLIGAALRRSPVSMEDMFRWPEVREGFIFTAEPSHEHCTVAACGVVSRTPGPYFRKLSTSETLYGHVHAVAFSHRPLREGVVDPVRTIRELFDEEDLRGILHLVHDDRGSYQEQSRFHHGALWIQPVSSVHVSGAGNERGDWKSARV